MSTPLPAIVVVLAADSMFTKQFAATIAGISKTATRKHQVFALHDGYEPGVIEQLSGIAGDAINLCWLDARCRDLEGAHLSYLPTAALFRLRITDLLPQQIERVIYLDTDISVRRPLDELWGMNLGGRPVAAVRDALIPWAAAPLGLPWSELGVPADTPYFNSGVLVIETARWRSQQISEQALELLKRHNFLQADQCALNTVLAGQWAPIRPKWNLQAGHLAGDRSLAWVTESHDALASAIDDPAAVHFNTSVTIGRPWQYGCTHPYRDLWFEHLDLTPWEGWRPAAPTRAQMLAARIRRAGTILIRG